MMNKKETPHRSIWKYALILPMVAMLLIFNYACNNAKAEKGNKENIVQEEELATMVQDSHQTDNSIDDVQQNPVIKGSKQIFKHCDQMPQFPGGDAALLNWLSQKITYPEVAVEQRIQGRVSIRFVVTSDGSVEDVEVLRSLDPACDKEAVTAVKKMPKWLPGKQDGIPVSVYYSLPVIFKLPNDTNANTISNRVTSRPNNPNAIVEIDGKVVSGEEWEKFNRATIKAITVAEDPRRIIIETKKE